MNYGMTRNCAYPDTENVFRMFTKIYFLVLKGAVWALYNLTSHTNYSVARICAYSDIDYFYGAFTKIYFLVLKLQFGSCKTSFINSVAYDCAYPDIENVYSAFSKKYNLY